MAPKKLVPLTRDSDAELDVGIEFDGLAAYWLDEAESLHVMGIATTDDGEPLNEYREIQVVVLDASGSVIGRDYTNWSDFGRKRPFSFAFSDDSLFGLPAEVHIFLTT